MKKRYTPSLLLCLPLMLAALLWTTPQTVLAQSKTVENAQAGIDYDDSEARKKALLAAGPAIPNPELAGMQLACAPTNILVYDNNSIFSTALTAVLNLGFTPTVANSGNFVSLLTGSTWDLVVMDNPSTEPAGAWQTALINHINGGGAAIHSHWFSSSLTPALQSAFEITTAGTHQTVDFYRWSGHPLFSSPESVPDIFDVWSDVWGTNGFFLEPTGGAVAAAGNVPTPTPNQGAIVIGNGGRTIFNGFLFDDYYPANKDGDSIRDIVELLMNEVALVCGGGIEFAVTKTVSNSKPAFGEVVTFTVTITNNGPGDAFGVEVTDALPAGLTFVGATTTKGGYNPATGLWNVGALPDGASETLTIDALVNTLDPVTNTATVTASSPSGGGSASATITPQAADLSLDKTVDDDDPAVGDIVSFTVTVSHLDGADVIGTRVEDQLPGGLNYVSHITTQGSYDPGTGNWQVGSLTEGQMESLVIMAEVIDAGGITNTAFIAFASQPDPFPGDNRDAASLNADAADLEVIKRVVAFSTEDGTITATFVVTVTNEGPSDVGGVVVTDELSPDMTEQSSVASQGTVVSAGSTLTWDVGALADGASATLTVTVTVPQSGSLLNTAEVTASDLPDPDSEPDDGEGDDFAAATAGPRQVPDFVPGAGPGGVLDRGDRFAADLALTKDVSVEGTSATYTIMVENLGPQSTARVEVTDHLPDCLSYDSSSADRGAYDPDTWIWTIGELKVGEKVTLEIVTTIGEECDGEVVNTATITSSSLPDPSSFFDLFGQPAAEANNSAEATFTVSSGRELDGRRFALGTNYPNPFNPTTVIPFSVAEASHVSIKVYDLLGRTVATLVDGTMSAGVHEVSFEAGSLPTGMYLVRMEASGQVYTQRMTLMK